jgi:hypothetical protein
MTHLQSGEPELLLSNFINGVKRLTATWTPELRRIRVVLAAVASDRETPCVVSTSTRQVMAAPIRVALRYA